MAARRYTPSLAIAAIAAAVTMVAVVATAPAPASASDYRGGHGGRGGDGRGRRWYRHRFGRRHGQCVPRLPLNAPRAGGVFAVANRGGGTVSLVDPDEAAVVDTYELPGGGEPMYLATPFGTQEVWVGDRANSELVRSGALPVCMFVLCLSPSIHTAPLFAYSLGMPKAPSGGGRCMGG